MASPDALRRYAPELIKNALIDMRPEFNLLRFAQAPTAAALKRMIKGKRGTRYEIELDWYLEAFFGVEIKDQSIDKGIVIEGDVASELWHVPISLNMHDLTYETGRKEIESEFKKRGADALAPKIEGSLGRELSRAPILAGTPGIQSDPHDVFSQAFARMNAVGIPKGNRVAVMANKTAAKLNGWVMRNNSGNNMPQIGSAEYTGGFGGFSSITTSQHIPNHTTGCWGNSCPQIDTGCQVGNCIRSDGWAPESLVLRQNDVIAIEGVMEWSQVHRKETGYIAQFSLQDDVWSDANGRADLPLYPTINPGGLVSTFNWVGQPITTNVRKNVNRAPADNARIFMAGEPNTTYEQSVFFHTGALMFIAIEPEGLRDIDVAAYRDPMTGINMRFSAQSDIRNMQTLYRLDSYYDALLMQPELAVRHWGSKVGDFTASRFF